MATNTTNLKLVKPAPDDFYDIAVHNGNMDKIDAAIQQLKTGSTGSVTSEQVTQQVNAAKAEATQQVNAAKAEAQQLVNQAKTEAANTYIPKVTTNVTGDWNNYKTNGYYDGANVANAPDNSVGWFYVEVIAHSLDGNSWVTQTAYDFNNNNVFRRSLSSGAWGAWSLIYSNGNLPLARNIHVSTAAPSGGNPNDVWHQYV